MKATHLAVAIAAAIAVPTVTLAGAFAYTAYQHEQECKGYEEKTTALVDDAVALRKEMEVQKQKMSNLWLNPSAANEVLQTAGWQTGRALRLAIDLETITNNFQETCGKERVKKFTTSPAMVKKFEVFSKLHNQ